MIQQMLTIWSLVPLPFLNPAWASGSSQFTYCWSLVWRILSISLIAWKMSEIVQHFEHSLALLYFGTGMKTDLFQSCGHCWVFRICWHIECSTFTASSFRIWNGSTGIPSPPLALFIVMLSKAHLTSHSRMSGSRWWWWFSCSVVSDSCNPMDCSPPGSSVHGISQTRMLEWVAISFSRGSAWPRDQICISADSLPLSHHESPIPPWLVVV